MTRDEILAMKPGRKFDKLIAIKLMGFSMTDDGNWGLKEDGRTEPVFEYSTDIAAAWEVVERLLEKGIATHIKCFLDTFSVECHELDVSTGIVTANTAPEAIVKAALLAVMGVNQ